MNRLIEKYAPTRENLLDILHALQDDNPHNYLTTAALRQAADYVGIPLSEVMSTATFYSMFSLKPRGRHIIRICESPPCLLLGAESVLTALQEMLEVQVGETSTDGAFTLETTSCLGACGVAPAMMIDDQLYGNLSRERLAEIIDRVRSSDEAR